ncbi:hypothetical protein DFJ77DRAFT_452058 [Powellomyces hirtus]|nr:hypothetical protein DFJ77DRAFT_452058 [Powellomyces hirtus]
MDPQSGVADPAKSARRGSKDGTRVSEAVRSLRHNLDKKYPNKQDVSTLRSGKVSRQVAAIENNPARLVSMMDVDISGSVRDKISAFEHVETAAPAAEKPTRNMSAPAVAPMTPSRKAAVAAKKVTRSQTRGEEIATDHCDPAAASCMTPRVWPEVRSRKVLFEPNVRMREFTEVAPDSPEKEAPPTPTRRSKRLTSKQATEDHHEKDHEDVLRTDLRSAVEENPLATPDTITESVEYPNPFDTPSSVPEPREDIFRAANVVAPSPVRKSKRVAARPSVTPAEIAPIPQNPNHKINNANALAEINAAYQEADSTMDETVVETHDATHIVITEDPSGSTIAVSTTTVVTESTVVESVPVAEVPKPTPQPAAPKTPTKSTLTRDQKAAIKTPSKSVSRSSRKARVSLSDNADNLLTGDDRPVQATTPSKVHYSDPVVADSVVEPFAAKLADIATPEEQPQNKVLTPVRQSARLAAYGVGRSPRMHEPLQPRQHTAAAVQTPPSLPSPPAIMKDENVQTIPDAAPVPASAAKRKRNLHDEGTQAALAMGATHLATEEPTTTAAAILAAEAKSAAGAALDASDVLAPKIRKRRKVLEIQPTPVKKVATPAKRRANKPRMTDNQSSDPMQTDQQPQQHRPSLLQQQHPLAQQHHVRFAQTPESEDSAAEDGEEWSAAAENSDEEGGWLLSVFYKAARSIGLR